MPPCALSKSYSQLLLHTPQKIPVTLPEGSLLLVEQLLQVNSDPGFIIGKTSCFPGYDVIHSEADVVSYALCHGVDVISMQLLSV